MLTTLALAGTLVLGASAIAQAQDAQAPLGGDEDVAYSQAPWQTLTDMRPARANAIDTVPYRGVEPHGAMLETFFTTATVDGHIGTVAVKRNYGPAAASAPTQRT